MYTPGLALSWQLVMKKVFVCFEALFSFRSAGFVCLFACKDETFNSSWHPENVFVFMILSDNYIINIKYIFFILFLKIYNFSPFCCLLFEAFKVVLFTCRGHVIYLFQIFQMHLTLLLLPSLAL